MAFGVENGGGSGIPAGRPPPLLEARPACASGKCAIIARFFGALRALFCHRQAIDKITNCGSVKVDALQKSKKQGEGGEFS